MTDAPIGAARRRRSPAQVKGVEQGSTPAVSPRVPVGLARSVCAEKLSALIAIICLFVPRNT